MRIFLIAVFAVFLSACATQNPKVPMSDIDKHIAFEGFSEDNVKSLKIRKNAMGLLEFEIIFRSSLNGDVLYKLDWLDEDGFALNDALSKEWRRIYLNAGKEYIFNKIAPNKDAKDFKIHLQRR